MTTATQIAAELNLAEQFITDVTVSDKYVTFQMNGVWYDAKLSRGKFKKENLRRSI